MCTQHKHTKSTRLVLLMISASVLVSLTSASHTEKNSFPAMEVHVPSLEEIQRGASVYYQKVNEVSYEEVKRIMKPVVREELSFEDQCDQMIDEICEMYPNVRPELIKAIVSVESGYNADARNGNNFGLMQIDPRYQVERMEKLDVFDLYDPYSNLLVGTDFISDLISEYESEELALMLYNMRWIDAFSLWNAGKVSNYARVVLAVARG